MANGTKARETRSSEVTGTNANKMQQPFNGRGYTITLNSQLQQACMLRKHWASLSFTYVHVSACVYEYVWVRMVSSLCRTKSFLLILLYALHFIIPHAPPYNTFQRASVYFDVLTIICRIIILITRFNCAFSQISHRKQNKPTNKIFFCLFLWIERNHIWFFCSRKWVAKQHIFA